MDGSDSLGSRTWLVGDTTNEVVEAPDAVHWLLWGVGILIAIRSIGRIAELAKHIGAKEDENK